MRIYNLTENSKVYTSNAYLIMGEWNTLDDINALVDVGSDPLTINKLNDINTGLGKNKIDRVIITHSHSDHTAILPEIKDKFNTEVYAYNSHLKEIDYKLNDKDFVKIGDQVFEVFHITVHSYDSICLYCENEKILFSGDTNFPIDFDNEILRRENEGTLERLSEKEVRKIYPGHGAVFDYNPGEFQVIKNKLIYKY